MAAQLTVLYVAESTRGLAWQKQIQQDSPNIRFYVWPEDNVDLASVDILVMWRIPQALLSQLTNLKAIFTVSAGIDQLDIKTIPEHIDIIRMIDDDLSDQLAEYSVMSVLMLYRQAFEYLDQQTKHQWQKFKLPPANTINIGLMGLGHQGQKIIQALRPFGFNLLGWSRSQHNIHGVSCYDAPHLEQFLSQLNILICVLPLTQQTDGILNRQLLNQLPKGSSIINIGRGKHLIIDDLIECLDSGHIHRAIIDVMANEPLEAESPLWDHPKIFVTPHIAGDTRAESGYRTLLTSITAWSTGGAPKGLVPRPRGY